MWALGFVNCHRDTKISEGEEHARQANLTCLAVCVCGVGGGGVRQAK